MAQLIIKYNSDTSLRSLVRQALIVLGTGARKRQIVMMLAMVLMTASYIFINWKYGDYSGY